MMPLIYTRGTFWNPNVGNPIWASDYLLWAARYSNTLTGPWSDGRYRPLPWNMWAFWQWSADKNGRGAEFGAESRDIDLNRFNGSLSEFYRWCGWQQDEPEPEPKPEPCGCCEAVKQIYDIVKDLV